MCSKNCRLSIWWCSRYSENHCRTTGRTRALITSATSGPTSGKNGLTSSKFMARPLRWVLPSRRHSVSPHHFRGKSATAPSPPCCRAEIGSEDLEGGLCLASQGRLDDNSISPFLSRK